MTPCGLSGIPSTLTITPDITWQSTGFRAAAKLPQRLARRGKSEVANDVTESKIKAASYSLPPVMVLPRYIARPGLSLVPGASRLVLPAVGLGLVFSPRWSFSTMSAFLRAVVMTVEVTTTLLSCATARAGLGGLDLRLARSG